MAYWNLLHFSPDCLITAFQEKHFFCRWRALQCVKQWWQNFMWCYLFQGKKKKSCNSCFYYVILIFVPRVMHSLYAILGRRVEFKSAEVVWIAKTSFLVPAGWCAKLWKAECLLVVCCLLPVNIWKIHKSAVPLSCNLNEYCNVGCRGKLWWHSGRGHQMVGWLQSSHFGILEGLTFLFSIQCAVGHQFWLLWPGIREILFQHHGYYPAMVSQVTRAFHSWTMIWLTM